nr:unnamed protein product [Callosobruchus analis]
MSLGAATDPLEEVGASSLPEDILSITGIQNPEISWSKELIHTQIAEVWQDIISNGLDASTIIKLVSKYPPPTNLSILSAPKINPGAMIAAGDTALKRDKKLAYMQSQIGASLAALGKALTLLLEEEGNERVQPLNL